MTPQTINPAAGDTASGARAASQGAVHSDHTNGTSTDKLKLTVWLPPSKDPITVEGREAQTLGLLIRVGARGSAAYTLAGPVVMVGPEVSQ